MSVELMTQELVLSREEARVFIKNAVWPKAIRVSLAFLTQADAGFLTLGPATINLFLSNGRAVYRIVRWDTSAYALVCELVESESPRPFPDNKEAV